VWAKQILVDHTTAVRAIELTSDADFIISAGDDGAIHVSSVNLGSVERKLVGHYDRVTCLKLTADDVILVSGNKIFHRLSF